MLENHAVARQPVQVGRLRQRVAVAASHVGVVLVGVDVEQVGALGLCHCSPVNAWAISASTVSIVGR